MGWGGLKTTPDFFGVGWGGSDGEHENGGVVPRWGGWGGVIYNPGPDNPFCEDECENAQLDNEGYKQCLNQAVDELVSF